MIYAVIAPNIDFKSLQNVCEKNLAVDPLEASDNRGYGKEDLRVWINAIRMSQDFNLSDNLAQKLLHLGYLISADRATLLHIGCHLRGNIKSNLGLYVGSLAEWRDCLISLMVEDSTEEVKDELFCIYNHLCFLKLDYLFFGYRLKGKILVRDSK